MKLTKVIASGELSYVADVARLRANCQGHLNSGEPSYRLVQANSSPNISIDPASLSLLYSRHEILHVPRFEFAWIGRWNGR